MQTRTIELATSDGPMPCYEAVPDSARTAVVVIQEAFGVNEHIQDVCRRLAAAGHHAAAPHLFHRAGGGTAPYDDFAKVLPLFKGLTDPGIRGDVDAAADHLNATGFADEAIGTVGFCMGGRATFLVATDRALGAAVGFYGGGIVTSQFPQFPSLLPDVPKLAAPWLGLFGDDDASIPVDDVETLRHALDAAPVATEVVRYAGAEHGFHCDVRPSYHPEAAADAWKRTLAWFDTHLTAG